jgi:hypothetical protein
MREKIGLERRPDLEAPPSEKASENEEDLGRDESSVAGEEGDVENETAAQKMINAARKKFVKRGITGSVSIFLLRGITSSTITTRIDDDDVADTDEDDMSVLDTKLISLYDQLLNSLERAAKAWESNPHAQKSTIARGSSIGFYLPFFISVGFTIQVTFEVDVSSLIRARQRRKRLKQFAKELKTVNAAFVAEVMQQGFPELLAQRAVIATGNSSVEDALRWAVIHADDGADARNSQVDGSAEV